MELLKEVTLRKTLQYYITLHYLTIPYNTLHYPTLPYITYITLQYLTLPSLPYIALHSFFSNHIFVNADSDCTIFCLYTLLQGFMLLLIY